ncbi:hypothetical protein MBAV_005377 [Candidatus Magnetobacterium bavaricum]|uniref:Uncharacterized protein n=1 Tax=Candidatus Magnetobacterium bavaricum TaxID=29290 RepID=A0A0F3GKJ2_9BACT|nr:hypothetical protein MBAV_005377 [Candidatus Magnetobacterium bavaricum]
MFRNRGKVLPTKANVNPVRKPLINGRIISMDSIGIRYWIKTLLRLPTAPEDSIVSLNKTTPRIRTRRSGEKPYFSTLMTALRSYL